MRRSSVVYLAACAIAALLPFFSAQSKPQESAIVPFPGWPAQFEGKTLTALPLNELEKGFASDFPGKLNRFTDGEREIVIRWVTEATRKLHPSSDCFQGLGYAINPLAMRRDESGSLWSSFEATKGNERLVVYERIHSDTGQSWTDVSAWYWSALVAGQGSWWAITVAEKRAVKENL
jgi:hypothetical protein